MILKVHQALHGYADGHRQLACSVTLPTKDARLLLVMSDLSGPGVSSLGLPYLTGYPLVESGLYALAKTWPAPEMSRPGCVWTHTLLIGFADLATLLSPSTIAEFFQRPVGKTPHSAYADDVVVESEASAAKRLFSSEASSWFETLASAVYEHPDAQVWARRADGSDVEDAVLRLWDQQWPRLKRSFRFCTLTSRDRSQEGMPFDLQLTPASEWSPHLRFSSSVAGFEATSSSTAPWLDALIYDAQFPHYSTLRAFLRKLGADMLGGREAMRSFCSLHTALAATGAESVSDAVRLVESSPALSASELVTSVVAEAAIEKVASVDGHVLEFVIDNVSLLPEGALLKHQDVLAQVLWDRDPRRFIALGCDSRVALSRAIRAGAASIPKPAILIQLPLVRDMPEPLLELLPITAETPQFWSTCQLLPTTAALAGIDLSKGAVLRAMILGLRDPDAIQAGLQAVGSLAALDCLQRLVNSTEYDDQVRFWMGYVCTDANAVAQYLVSASAPSRQLLLFVADALHPDAVPNDVGNDPWWLTLQALAAAEGTLPLELQVYGFRRALGKRSCNVEELLNLTFEPLHAAAESDAFPEDQWRLIEGSLPWAPFGQEWDHAIRLRRATARKCADLEMSAISLARLVRSDALFVQLLEQIWEVWGGPRYLRSVSEALEQPSHRRRLLKDFIKQHSKLW